jgi:hypothetical protein
MWKGLAVLALLVCLTPHDRADQQRPASGAKNDQKPAQTTPPAPAQATDSQDIQNAAPGNKSSDEPKSVRVILPSKDAYDHASFWISLALAVAGFGGVGVGVCTVLFLKNQVVEMRKQRILMNRTLLSIRRQSLHMARQIDIQEANMSQWVEADIYGIRTEGLTTKPNSNAIETAKITLQGRVINQTSLPLTIKKIVTSISGVVCIDRKEFEIETNELLSPRKEGSEVSFSFFVDLTLDADFTLLLLNTGFNASVLIWVTFIEASGHEKHQGFPSIIRCTTHNVEKLHYVGVGLTS